MRSSPLTRHVLRQLHLLGLGKFASCLPSKTSGICTTTVEYSGQNDCSLRYASTSGNRRDFGKIPIAVHIHFPASEFATRVVKGVVRQERLSAIGYPTNISLDKQARINSSERDRLRRALVTVRQTRTSLSCGSDARRSGCRDIRFYSLRPMRKTCDVFPSVLLISNSSVFLFPCQAQVLRGGVGRPQREVVYHPFVHASWRSLLLTGDGH